MVFMAKPLQNSWDELILTFILVKGHKVPNFRIDHEKMNQPKLDRIPKLFLAFVYMCFVYVLVPDIKENTSVSWFHDFGSQCKWRPCGWWVCGLVFEPQVQNLYFE